MREMCGSGLREALLASQQQVRAQQVSAAHAPGMRSQLAASFPSVWPPTWRVQHRAQQVEGRLLNEDAAHQLGHRPALHCHLRAGEGAGTR